MVAAISPECVSGAKGRVSRTRFAGRVRHVPGPRPKKLCKVRHYLLMHRQLSRRHPARGVLPGRFASLKRTAPGSGTVPWRTSP